MVSVGRRSLCGSAVAQGLVETARVPPVLPPHGGLLDRLDALPEPRGVDELGLVEPVDGLGQVVVVRVAHGAYRSRHPGGDEGIAVRQTDVLRGPIAVVGQALSAAGSAGGDQCVLQGEQRQSRGVETGRDGPSPMRRE